MYYTADRETGTFIEGFKTIREALAAIKSYEKYDVRKGIYEADFYDVVNEEHCTVTDI